MREVTTSYRGGVSGVGGGWVGGLKPEFTKKNIKKWSIQTKRYLHAT